MNCLQNIKFYYGSQTFKIPVKTQLVYLPKRTSLYVSADYQGHQLWAECSAFETDWYENETWPQIYQQLKYYQQQLETIEINDEWYASLSQLLTFNHAKDIMDYLMWQAYAIKQQQSLTQILSKQTIIDCGMTINTDSKQSFQQLLPQVIQYPRVKLKWHDHVIDFIQQLPKNIMIAIDANGQLTQQHFKKLMQLSQYNIAYIEQPFSHVKAYQQFKQSGIHIPIAIDESAKSLQDIQLFSEQGWADIICLKHGRLGGISSIKSIINKIKLPFFAGGMYEVNQAQYETALIQSMIQSIYPADLVRDYFYQQVSPKFPWQYDLSVLPPTAKLSLSELN